jgi:protein-S-isoprenylcysteine O-methyltransferase Ste14
MKIKGFDKFLAKLPDYQGKRMARIPLITAFSFLLSLGIMIFLDVSPRIFSSMVILRVMEPLMPVISTIIFQVIGIFLINRIWSKKNTYLEKYKEKAYQKSFVYIITGIPFFVASMLHGFIPIDILWPSPIEGSITWIMAKPLSIFLFSQEGVFIFIRVIIGFSFLILGIGTVLRAMFTFGFDYMSIIYVYYPEESKVQNHDIYSILRHPTYHGLILMSFSSIFFSFSIYSIFICLLFILGMNIHLKVTEEKELLERFGDSYRKYMYSTHALFYNPKYIKKYFLFLIGKK